MKRPKTEFKKEKKQNKTKLDRNECELAKETES